MSLDENIYVNLEQLNIYEKQPHEPVDTDSCTEGAEAVVSSDTTHFNVATVCLGLLSFTLLITAVGVGTRFHIVYAQLMGQWLNSSLQTEALQFQILNLTAERDQMNNSYFSVMKELHRAKANMVSCPGGWRQFGLRCYYLSQSLNTWVNSRRECQNMGADLVVIKSQEEMRFLNEFGHKFWIGLSRIDGVWKWIDGSSVIVSDRGNYHPTLYNGYQKTCAAFNILNLHFYTRSSESCESYYRGVCEKEANFNSVI
ncbi:C-type lectin domain family 9 member A-like [Periophthalmus magnuspinnatus]|uniref:C-type lectin domain family 9 member A-like n=1 Tax=Periophthalmus magnuspinnatus TaxID=409849 RepID=UPI00145C06EB|nr:C-type lectin domain family 9 member A-like [Periophthalmus magnuspinnatus]